MRPPFDVATDTALVAAALLEHGAKWHSPVCAGVIHKHRMYIVTCVCGRQSAVTRGNIMGRKSTGCRSCVSHPAGKQNIANTTVANTTVANTTVANTTVANTTVANTTVANTTDMLPVPPPPRNHTNKEVLTLREEKRQLKADLKRTGAALESLQSAIGILRADINSARKKQQCERARRRWNPDGIVVAELVAILNFVEAQLDRTSTITITCPARIKNDGRRNLIGG